MEEKLSMTLNHFDPELLVFHLAPTAAVAALATARATHTALVDAVSAADATAIAAPSLAAAIAIQLVVAKRSQERRTGDHDISMMSTDGLVVPSPPLNGIMSLSMHAFLTQAEPFSCKCFPARTAC